jgi:rhodanese-related sulfurtransferase
MAIENIAAEDLRDLLRKRPEEIEIIDVRSREEYDALHIKGSRLIPMDELPQRAHEIEWQKEVIFVCRSGRRSRVAAELASATGEPVRNLRLGILECLNSGERVFLAASGDGPSRRLKNRASGMGTN